METRVAIVEDDQVTEILVERNRDQGILGNIYKGKVTKVLPGMQAAFVDIGLERDAFLYVTDFLEDYEEYKELLDEVERGPGTTTERRPVGTRSVGGKEACSKNTGKKEKTAAGEHAF